MIYLKRSIHHSHVIIALPKKEDIMSDVNVHEKLSERLDKFPQRTKDMHRIIQISMFVVVMIICSALEPPLKAQDNENYYCYLVAYSKDVGVEAWENDRLGNKGQLIWRGIIREGQSQKIYSRFGRIRYASDIYTDSKWATSGDVNRWCDSGNTIGVP